MTMGLLYSVWRSGTCEMIEPALGSWAFLRMSSIICRLIFHVEGETKQLSECCSIEADISTSPDSMNGRLADGFANLLRDLWGGSYPAVHPEKLRELINESPESNQLFLKSHEITIEPPRTPQNIPVRSPGTSMHYMDVMRMEKHALLWSIVKWCMSTRSTRLPLAGLEYLWNFHTLASQKETLDADRSLRKNLIIIDIISTQFWAGPYGLFSPGSGSNLLDINNTMLRMPPGCFSSRCCFLIRV